MCGTSNVSSRAILPISATAVASKRCAGCRRSHIAATVAAAKKHNWKKSYITPAYSTAPTSFHPPYGSTGRCRTQATALGAVPSDMSTVTFDSEWVNTVGLTGLVVKGPALETFSKSGKRRALMLLGLFNRTTGDQMADRPHPVLVVAWNEKADALASQVQLGATLFVLGHLSLDYRATQNSTCYGPALYVTADKWCCVALGSVPESRYPCHGTGEFDVVFRRAGRAATYCSGDVVGQRISTEVGTAGNTHHHQQQLAAAPASCQLAARKLLLGGKQLSDIAHMLGVRRQTLMKDLVQAAVQEGADSQLWPLLLGAAHLTSDNERQQQPPQSVSMSADQLYEAVQQAVQFVGQDGWWKPLRKYLLSDQSGVADVLQRHELTSGGAGGTYDKLQVLLALRRLGQHPSKYL